MMPPISELSYIWASKKSEPSIFLPMLVNSSHPSLFKKCAWMFSPHPRSLCNSSAQNASLTGYPWGRMSGSLEAGTSLLSFWLAVAASLLSKMDLRCRACLCYSSVHLQWWLAVSSAHLVLSENTAMFCRWCCHNCSSSLVGDINQIDQQ